MYMNACSRTALLLIYFRHCFEASQQGTHQHASCVHMYKTSDAFTDAESPEGPAAVVVCAIVLAAASAADSSSCTVTVRDILQWAGELT
jgi:uncharacterized phosphosugar-binding protein